MRDTTGGSASERPPTRTCRRHVPVDASRKGRLRLREAAALSPADEQPRQPANHHVHPLRRGGEPRALGGGHASEHGDRIAGGEGGGGSLAAKRVAAAAKQGADAAALRAERRGIRGKSAEGEVAAQRVQRDGVQQRAEVRHAARERRALALLAAGRVG